MINAYLFEEKDEERSSGNKIASTIIDVPSRGLYFGIEIRDFGFGPENLQKQVFAFKRERKFGEKGRRIQVQEALVDLAEIWIHDQAQLKEGLESFVKEQSE